MGPHYLNKLFSPGSIAVVGASDENNTVGMVVFRNLLDGGFKGSIYPVNLKHDVIQNEKAYQEISQIPEKIDLAVIATPAKTVPDIVRQCGEAGVRAAVILSAGFSEAGAQGKHLEKESMDYALHYGIRIIGPNCLGVMCPHLGLNATFSHNIALPGPLALVSQSGALCTAMLDWARQHNIGFSTMISLGDTADVDYGDVLTWLALDRNTSSILLYVEGIRNARSFISGLRIAGRMKPVVVIKAGRHDESTHAAISHTGAIVGSDDVFHAAINRAGTVRVNTIDQLFSAAQLLASENYRVKGNRLAIITNGGGLGVMAADHAIENNVLLPPLDENIKVKLNTVLPDHWSHNNPIDVLGDADVARYRVAVSVCMESEQFDGVLVMLAPQAMTQATAVAQTVADLTKAGRKPLLVCWMGGEQVAEAHKIFSRNNIAHFDTPEDSIEAFSYMANYRRNQELLMQVPEPMSRRSEPDTEGTRMIIDVVLGEDRKLLTNMETTAILRAFSIPVVPMMEADSAAEALVAAESLGFPIAMKINSPDITHKSDVSGVRLNVSNAGSVRTMFKDLVETVKRERPGADIKGVILERMYQRPNGRELMIGMIRDPVFGPAISVGAGGTMVEVMQDSVTLLPPLNRFIVRQALDQTRVNRILGEFRGTPAVNRAELENVLLRVSELVCEIPQIVEMDINPLIVDDEGVLVVDARIVVEYQPVTARKYAHMAIHPYPSNLVSQCQLNDGTNVTIRPIRPEDAFIEQQFVRALSPQSKYFRFMASLQELTPEMLIRFTQIDYDLEMALIGVVQENNREVEIGVARYTTNPDGRSCEFAIVISDKWHNRGLGFRMMERLMEIAREKGLLTIEGAVLTENREMLKLSSSLGFDLQQDPDDSNLVNISRRLYN